MSRTRTRGAQNQGYILPITGSYREESRWVWLGGSNYKIETRRFDDPVGSGIACTLNDYETITDVVGHRELYNSCSHTRMCNIPVSVRLARRVDPIQPRPLGYTWHTTTKDNGTLSGLFSPRYNFGTHDWPVVTGPNPGWSSLVEKVGIQLDGSMAARTLVLATVAELGQTVRMIRNPYNLLHADWRRAVKNLTPRQLGKAGANVWLEKRYGWDNLYRDVKTFSRAHQAVSDHIRYLAQTQGRWSPISEVELSDCTYSSGTISGTGATSSARIVPSVSSYRQAARFSLDVFRDAASRVFTAGELYQQYLGANQLVETLWEITPFSFLVDWFIDIGDLAAYAPIMWNSHRLMKIGSSLERELSCFLTITSRAETYAGYSEITSRTSPHVVFKTYQRSPGLPSGTARVGLFGGLSLTHLADGAAIIAQRI